MATHINLGEANAWLEPTKLTLSSVDTELESQVSTQVLGRLLAQFDTTSWVNSAATPKVVRTIIAMYYVSWIYDRAYSDDAEANSYAALLRQYADLNLQAILDGTVEIEEYPLINDAITKPSFFPNDASSANAPTDINPSDGPPAFTMGTVF